MSITIRPVNDAPIAEAKTLSLDEDTQTSMLLSETDIDSPAPTVFQLVVVPPAAVGQVTLAGATATFKPAKDWNGATQFTYRAQDTAADQDGGVQACDGPRSSDDALMMGSERFFLRPGIL